MKNKYNNLIKYIICIVLISLLTIIGISLLTQYNLKFRQRFNYNFLYITSIMTIFFGGIGVVLDLDNIINLCMNKNKVQINRSKLLILGIPSFIISMTYIWGYLGVFNASPDLFSYLMTNDYIIIISNILLGNTIISSFYKDKS